MTTERNNRATASQPVAGGVVVKGNLPHVSVTASWPVAQQVAVRAVQVTGRDILAGVVRERFGPVRCRISHNKLRQVNSVVMAMLRQHRASAKHRNPSSISCVEPSSARVSQAGMVSGEIPERVRALLPMKHLLGAISDRSASFLHDTLRAGW